MAVTSITKLNSGRSAGWDGKGMREYQQTYRVATNDPADGPLKAELAVASSYGIVQNFTVYNDGNGVYDLAALAESIRGEPEEEENPYRFIVRVVYTTRVYDEIARKGGVAPTSPQQGQGGGSPGDSSSITENPLLQPAEVSTDPQERMRVAEKDLRGKPVVNAAGERFDPPKEMPDGFLVLTITRNEAEHPFNPLNYFNAINVDVFGSFPPLSVMCKGIRASNAYWYGFQYWKVTYTFWITDDLDGWAKDEIFLEHGWNQRVPVGPLKWELRPCINAVGDRVDGLLDHLDGLQIIPGIGVPTYTVEEDGPTYWFFKRRDFAPLNLGHLLDF